MAAPMNNCVLIIHMILSASQLNVHTCVVEKPKKLVAPFDRGKSLGLLLI